jgi:fructokinase
VLDVNLRAPHIQRLQVEYLLQKADILKMNRSEFDLISGWFTHLQKAEDNMKRSQDRFHIEKIIVSLAKEGALMLDKGAVFRHPGYRVPVADTIGCGDAFLAGLLYQFIKGAEPLDVLNYANCLGALVATYSGACPDYETEYLRGIVQT